MYLTADHYRQLSSALIDAFDAESLRRMLREGLGIRLDTVASPTAALPTIIDETLAWAQRQDRVDELVRAAKAFVPANQHLQKLPDRFPPAGSPDAPPSVHWQPVLDRLEPLLLPHVWSPTERQDLLTEAFHVARRTEMFALRLDGVARDFAGRCLRQIVDIDASMLLLLIDTLGRRVGAEDRAALRAVRADVVVRLPAGGGAMHDVPRPQDTVGAPLPEHPTLFLSYSPDDAAFAQILRTQLAQVGHTCSTANPHPKGSDAWRAQVGMDMSWARAAIVVAGPQTWNDFWVKVELLDACNKDKPILVVQVDADRPDRPPPYLAVDGPPIGFADHPDAALRDLLGRLPAPLTGVTPPLWTALTPDLERRLAELDYLSQLKLAELQHVAHYTRLAGTAALQRTRAGGVALPTIAPGPHYAHRPWAEQERVTSPVVRRFDDAVTQLKAIHQAVLLGEPGAGKTTTLYKLAADLIDAALLDRHAPIPLLVRLGNWKEAGEDFVAFLGRSSGALGDDLPRRLQSNRAVLLLDGLNEVPADLQATKYAAVRQFLADHRHLTAVVTCREHDYPPERELGIDRVTIEPLDPPRMHAFIHTYLDHEEGFGPSAAEGLFWRLAGDDAQERYAAFVEEVGARLTEPLTTFWLADRLPDGVTWGRNSSDNVRWEWWLRQRRRPGSLLQLTTNPYMLHMLVDVYRAQGTLPANRGRLFDQFVERLLVREWLFGWDGENKTVIRHTAGAALLDGLTELAFAMQRQRGEGDGGGALTVLSPAHAAAFLDETQRYQAASASLLALGDAVRFTHQLLQEYFAARAMRQRIFAPPAGGQALQAAEIWQPPRWWEPTNWEEAVILLAGLDSDDCTPVLKWVADAQPEVAARCIVESGAQPPEATKLWLRDRWLPRLTDRKRDPDIRARAAVGRALGWVAPEDGAPLDNRPGVGWFVRDGVRLPDIAWGGAVPAGQYQLQKDTQAFRSLETRTAEIHAPYRLARYPVTYAQFQCFLDAPDRDDPRWWAGMPERYKDWSDNEYPVRAFADQAFPFANHPREAVSWYQVTAFCRWLDHHLRAAGAIGANQQVLLPHEDEWEVAARYAGAGRVDDRVYPWGDADITPEHANTTKTGIGQTTAVGLFPAGRQPVLGLDDLSGNVWEWCRNKVENPADDGVDGSGAPRTLRGGSWGYPSDFARASSRGGYHPGYRDDYGGFRVVCVVRPPSHQAPAGR